ncbi:uncharacterized protein LOC110863211 isoform X2 [Folsomia candida]|uniref:uncharacterized protein LOC110863211 isoform X2 n=1 Tax=Folsomia candida TaxID=158441 RepID=UPI001604D57B|nr:uncharacterized protein LOC110863211 isoform X2 [Folsomia candida]
MVYLQGIVYNYLFGAICLLFNFFYGGFCCEQLSSISWIPGEFDRVTKVVNNAWKHCRVQITEECSKNIGYNQFCAEQFCEFNYEELESLKPQKQCQPIIYRKVLIKYIE